MRDYKGDYLNLFSVVVEAINAWEAGRMSGDDVCEELKELLDGTNAD